MHDEKGERMTRSPIPNSKAHRIADKNHSDDCLAAQFSIRVDTVADGNDYAEHVRETDDAHGEHDTEPLHIVCGSYAPEDQAAWDQES